MKHFTFKNIFLILIALLATSIFASCDEPESEENNKKEETDVKSVKTSVLIYAVASNSLHYNFFDDLDEIRCAAENINLSDADILVYSVNRTQEPSLSRLVKNDDDTFGFRVIKSYDRSQFSTDPARISTVIEDYTEYSKADNYGLILWSHATGWTPDFDDHIVPTVTPETTSAVGPITSISATQNFSFGVDKNNGVSDHCDIIELAEAIPSGFFDFIWFDCCYMSQIEVFYQLRNKANFIIASPTELAAEGMPYQLTMPLLAEESYSLRTAVETEADYFSDKNVVYSIAMIDTSALEDVAKEAETVVAGKRPGPLGLQRYNMSGYGPFYDFGQYITKWGLNPDIENNTWTPENFEKAMNKLVIFKSASSENWDRNPIKEENFSGIGCHFFYDDDSEEAEYYKDLEWFKRVYTTIP